MATSSSSFPPLYYYVSYMSPIVFRCVAEQDAADVLVIYAPYITNTAITFEYEVPSVDEFRSRIRTISADYPYFVCEVEGQIVGYAYAHRHMERAAYRWNAELSIYISQEFTHKGLGKVMYTTLIRLLQLQGVRHAYGCLTIPNEKSRQLHEALGFALLGVFPKAGYKMGEWRSIAWYGKEIMPLAASPEPFRSIREVEELSILQILKEGADEATAGFNRG